MGCVTAPRTNDLSGCLNEQQIKYGIKYSATERNRITSFVYLGSEIPSTIQPCPVLLMGICYCVSK